MLGGREGLRSDFQNILALNPLRLGLFQREGCAITPIRKLERSDANGLDFYLRDHWVSADRGRRGRSDGTIPDSKSPRTDRQEVFLGRVTVVATLRGRFSQTRK